MRIQRGVPLATHTTFKLGGPAKFFGVVKSVKDIQEAVLFAKENKLAIFMLGAGSNILIKDEGFDGLVLKMDIKGISISGNRLSAFAGELWDKVVRTAVKNGLCGIENLALIPGTVGGAVYQNIGAYGAEFKDVAVRILVFDASLGKTRWIPVSSCKFSYRSSLFREDETRRFIILCAELRLSKKFIPNIGHSDLRQWFLGKKASSSAVLSAVTKIRRSKLPYPPLVANAGSFFKNPVIPGVQLKKLQNKFKNLKFWDVGSGRVKLSSAQMIELAGWKGRRFGRVGVSGKHALVLVHHGGGTSKDLSRLADAIKNDILKRFGVSLEKEVQVL